MKLFGKLFGKFFGGEQKEVPILSEDSDPFGVLRYKEKVETTGRASERIKNDISDILENIEQNTKSLKKTYPESYDLIEAKKQEAIDIFNKILRTKNPE